LVPGFLEFVSIVDHILQELAEQNQLAPDVDPQALRSGLMGAIEGMLRDKILARSLHYPANFSAASVRSICFAFLSSALRRQGIEVRGAQPSSAPRHTESAKPSSNMPFSS
jgi:hypothetical protein